MSLLSKIPSGIYNLFAEPRMSELEYEIRINSSHEVEHFLSPRRLPWPEVPAAEWTNPLGSESDYFIFRYLLHNYTPAILGGLTCHMDYYRLTVEDVLFLRLISAPIPQHTFLSIRKKL